MYELELTASWIDDSGRKVGYPVFAGYTGEWSHSGQQNDNQIIPNPNISIWYGEVDGATLTALESDVSVVILWSQLKEIDDE